MCQSISAQGGEDSCELVSIASQLDSDQIHPSSLQALSQRRAELQVATPLERHKLLNEALCEAGLKEMVHSFQLISQADGGILASLCLS